MSGGAGRCPAAEGAAAAPFTRSGITNGASRKFWSAGLRPASHAPVSDRHRAGARNPPQQRWPRQSHACKPTHPQPRRITPNRRSPTGIARERETRTNDRHANLTPANPRGSARANLDSRRRGPGKASELGAVFQSKPASNRTESRGHGAPVSDRHRAGARNPHQRRWPRQSHGRAGAKPTHRQPRRITWSMERRSPTGIARERETRTDNAAPRQSHGQERRSPTGTAARSAAKTA